MDQTAFECPSMPLTMYNKSGTFPTFPQAADGQL